MFGKIVDKFGCFSTFSKTPLLFEIYRWRHMYELVFRI